MLSRATILLFTRVAPNSAAVQECSGAANNVVRAITSSATFWRLHDPLPSSRPPGTLVGAEKADLVNAFLSLENGARADTIREKLQAARRDFERFPGDTGSTEVQVAVLTARIYSLADHLTTHRKDHNSRRGLQGLLNRRRSLLQYLRRSNFDRYAVLISRLGLKDNYAPQDRYSVRYKAAVRQQPSGGGEGA